MMGEEFRIAAVQARQVLDSRAAATVEAEVTLAGGVRARAAAPSGASTGRHEALELRDVNSPLWGGRGVTRAVEHARSVFGPAVQGLDARDQRALDAMLREVDGTAGFTRLGANAALAVSLAAARAASVASGQPFYRWVANLAGATPLLPVPMVNMISGGAHAGGNLDIQDVLAIPVGATGYRVGLEMIVRVYWALRALLIEAGHLPLVGDEGGFGPRLAANEAALALLAQAIERAALRPGIDVAIAVDVAANQFAYDGVYRLAHADDQVGVQELDAASMIALIEQWASKYPLVSVEDALSEDDWAAWVHLTTRLGPRLQVLGDDLFTTNSDRVQHGIAVGAANAVLVKVNQIGTLTGALDTVRLAREGGYRIVVSARSGETEDDWLADLAVGTGADQIKIGSVARSERLAKYNRLLRIEEEWAAR
jgi:enolase